MNRQLVFVVGSYHVSEGEYSSDPVALWLYFDPPAVLGLKGASNGWNLTVEDGEPQSYDMGELGSICLQHLNEHPCFSELTQRTLSQAWTICSADTPDDIVGVRLDFDSTAVRILNWGDELIIVSELPMDQDFPLTERTLDF